MNMKCVANNSSLSSNHFVDFLYAYKFGTPILSGQHPVVCCMYAVCCDTGKNMVYVRCIIFYYILLYYQRMCILGSMLWVITAL